MRAGHGFALMAVILWSANSVIGKLVMHGLGPVSLTLARFGIALVVFAAVFGRSILRERPWPKTDGWAILLAGITGICLFNSLIYLGLRYSTATNVGLISAVSPLTTMVLSHFVLGERSQPLHYLGFFVAFAGLVWILTSGDPSRLLKLQLNLGDLLALGASAAWSVYSLAIKPLTARWSLPALNLIVIAVGVLLLTPAAVLEQRWQPAGGLELHHWLLVLFLGVGPSVVSFLFWARALREIGASRALGIYNLFPVFSTISATLWLGERPSGAFLVGGSAVVIGAYTMSYILPVRGKSVERSSEQRAHHHD